MSGQKKIMVAKTRGVFTGAALGYALLGPTGAALGAAMNRRQEFYRDMTDEELAAEKAAKQAKYERQMASNRRQWRWMRWVLLVWFGIGGAVWVAAGAHIQ